MTEIWRDIEGYEGWYQVSNYGRVKSLARTVNYGDKSTRTQAEGFLNLRNSGNALNGYFYKSVILCKNKRRKQIKVHRLVAEAFVEKPEGCNVVNHLDNNPSNNAASNLEWTTIVGNNKHRHIQGRSSAPKGAAQGSSFLSEQGIEEIKNLLAGKKHSQQQIADMYQVHQSHISRIKLGKAWAHLSCSG